MTKANYIFEKIARGIDSNLQKLPSFTYPDGDHPDWYDSEDTNLANTKPDPPLFARKRPKLPKGPASLKHSRLSYGPNNLALVDGINPASMFAYNRKPFPKGPKSPKGSRLSYGQGGIALVDGLDPTKPLFATGTSRKDLPKGPSSPGGGRIDYDDNLVASVKGGVDPNKPASPDRSLNHWLADYSLRQERGLHNPKLRPIAHVRQELKDKGFKIPNAATGHVGKQTNKTRQQLTADQKSAKKYDKKVQKIMRRVGLT